MKGCTGLSITFDSLLKSTINLLFFRSLLEEKGLRTPRGGNGDRLDDPLLDELLEVVNTLVFYLDGISPSLRFTVGDRSVLFNLQKERWCLHWSAVFGTKYRIIF